MAVTNENCINKEIYSRLNSGKAYYHSVQNLWSSCLLSKSLKIKIYKTITLPVVFHTKGSTQTEGEVRTVLRRIFRPQWEEVTGGWRRQHNEELNELHASTNIIRVMKSRRMRWAGHVA